MMVHWERCCNGSSTSDSQDMGLWIPEHDVVVPRDTRFLIDGTQNVGSLNHEAFNLGNRNAGSLAIGSSSMLTGLCPFPLPL